MSSVLKSLCSKKIEFVVIFIQYQTKQQSLQNFSPMIDFQKKTVTALVPHLSADSDCSQEEEDGELL